MQRTDVWLAVLPLLAATSLTGCTQAPVSADAEHHGPAVVEHIEGSDLSRVTLTARAAERIGIETSEVRSVPSSEAEEPGRTAMPYGALLYDARGETWTYTSPESLVYVRHAVTVDQVDGDMAILSAGPPVGTTVVTVGAAELFGTEFEVGH